LIAHQTGSKDFLAKTTLYRELSFMCRRKKGNPALRVPQERSHSKNRARQNARLPLIDVREDFADLIVALSRSNGPWIAVDIRDL